MLRVLVVLLTALLLSACATPTYTPPAPTLDVAIMRGDVAAVERRLKAGEDPNKADENGFTAVHKAGFLGEAQGRSGAVMAKVLAYGGDPSLQAPPHQFAPLHMVKSADAAIALIEAGADIHARSAQGLTPLHNAGSAEIVRILLDRGADPEAKGENGITPVQMIQNKIDGTQQAMANVSNAGAQAIFRKQLHRHQSALAVLQGKEPPALETAVAGAPAKIDPKIEALVIPDNSGDFLSPFTTDGVVAEWVDKAINADMGGSVGSAVGAAAGAYAANTVLDNVPFGGLIGGMLGSQVGEAIGRDAAIEASGGWEYIRQTSDQSFRSLDDMARYLVAAHSKATTFQEVVTAADKVYPGLQDAVVSAY